MREVWLWLSWIKFYIHGEHQTEFDVALGYHTGIRRKAFSLPKLPLAGLRVSPGDCVAVLEESLCHCHPEPPPAEGPQLPHPSVLGSTGHPCQGWNEVLLEVLPSHAVLHELSHGSESPWICDPMGCSVLMEHPQPLGCSFGLALVIPHFHWDPSSSHSVITRGGGEINLILWAVFLGLGMKKLRENKHLLWNCCFRPWWGFS